MRVLPLVLPFALIIPHMASAELLSSTNPSIRSALCVGADCANTEAPRTDELMIKSTSPGIDFNDTSTGGSDAVDDWRIEANDSGEMATYFTVENATQGTQPFFIDGDANTNTLYVAADNRVGIGTFAPGASLHLRSLNTPAVRFEQDTSGGLPARIWDVLANENTFSVRDTTESTVPLVIERAAPTGAIWVQEDSGDVGFGNATPDAPIHVLRSTDATNANSGIIVENSSSTTGPRGLLQLRNNGQVYFGLEDTSIAAGNNSGRSWNFQNLNGTFRVTTAPGGAGEVEMVLDVDGNMTIEGNYFASSGQQLNVPDYVFAEDYDLRPLSEVQAFITAHKHLPDVPSAEEINATGLNMTDMQLRLLQKVEELTLYTLDLEAARNSQAALIAAQGSELAELRDRLNRLETPANDD